MLWFLHFNGSLPLTDFDSISLDDAETAYRAIAAYRRWEHAMRPKK